MFASILFPMRRGQTSPPFHLASWDTEVSIQAPPSPFHSTAACASTSSAPCREQSNGEATPALEMAERNPCTLRAPPRSGSYLQRDHRRYRTHYLPAHGPVQPALQIPRRPGESMEVHRHLRAPSAAVVCAPC